MEPSFKARQYDYSTWVVRRATPSPKCDGTPLEGINNSALFAKERVSIALKINNKCVQDPWAQIRHEEKNDTSPGNDCDS